MFVPSLLSSHRVCPSPASCPWPFLSNCTITILSLLQIVLCMVNHPLILGDATDIRYQELTNCDLQMVSGYCIWGDAFKISPLILSLVLALSITHFLHQSFMVFTHYHQFYSCPFPLFLPSGWETSSVASRTPWLSSRGVPSKTSSTMRKFSS